MAESSLLLLTVAGFVAIFFLATVVTLPFRQAGQLDPAKTASATLALGWEFLLMQLSRPLTVLGVTYLLLAILGRFPDEFSHWQPDPQYLWAWYLFWIFLLLFNLNEAVGQILVHSHNRHRIRHRILFLLMRLCLVGGSAFVVFHLVLDFDTAKLFTSTAVVAAVLGFALREVLSNYLAGISLNLAGTVEPNQWVAIGDKEGEVIQRTWRETRIRSTAGHIYVVPNSTVASSTLNHMTWGLPQRRHHLHVTVEFGASPHLVRSLLVQAALSVAEVDRDYKQPDAYLFEFKDFGQVFRLRFWSRTYHDRTHLEGEVNERIWYQLRRHNITIPFPEGGNLSVQTRDPSAPAQPAATAADKLERLRQCGFVQEYLTLADGTRLVSDQALLSFADGLEVKLFGAGEKLCQQGTLGESCYVLIRGALQGRIELGLEGKFSQFAVDAGQLVGEMTLLTGLPRTATITAQEEVELLEVPGPMFTRLLAMHVEIPQRLASIMARRSKAMMEALQDVANRTAPEREGHPFGMFFHLADHLHQQESALPPASSDPGG